MRAVVTRCSTRVEEFDRPTRSNRLPVDLSPRSFSGMCRATPTVIARVIEGYRRLLPAHPTLVSYPVGREAPRDKSPTMSLVRLSERSR